jgi:DNA-binding transcriptional LysR family regulator
MVRNGLGRAILPHTAVQDEIARGALGFRPLERPPLACTHVVAFHQAPSTTLVASFAVMARDTIATLAEGGAWQRAQILWPKLTSPYSP